jgi:crotonobetainyl-CoA:carnitine CoA-transferase CaiB-like acyl-CoA transferase
VAGPLAGFRILDLSAVVSGPLTGALLADQGADVIKVERTGEGDIQRHVGSRRNGYSGFFHVLNRGKRSLAVDLTTPEGVDIVRRAAQGSDAVIQNFRPGVVDRLGIGYADLSARNPGLVYLSISGFGQTGPRAGERAYDPIIQCYAGMADVQGRIHPEHPDRPEQVNMLLADKLTAATGCQAITAALLARAKSGRGQHIELSMLDTLIAFAWSDVASDLILQGDGVDERPPVGASGTVLHFRDGWGATMTLSQNEFEGMCRAYGLEHIVQDPRFSTLAARQAHRVELREILAAEVARMTETLTLEEAGRRLAAEQVPFARVRRLTELHEDAQVQHNGMFRDIDHPVAGRLRDARPAPRFSDTPAEPGAPAPTAGQHTREILTELGLAEHLDDYYQRGIVS